MKTLVLYDTQFGNTKAIAETIGAQLQTEGSVRVAPIGGFPMQSLAGFDLLIVGGPTQAHGMTDSMRQFLGKVDVTSSALQAAAFDTRVKGPVLLWGSAAKEIESKLRGAGLRVIVPAASFLVTLAKEPVLHQGEKRRAADWAKEVVRHVNKDLLIAV
jgi:flavodoxin